jgi:hypothetical protein
MPSQRFPVSLELTGTEAARMDAALKMWDAACGLAEETRDLLSANDAFNAMLWRLDITPEEFHKALAKRTKNAHA